MPFLYVYSPSDFVGGLPDESGAAAAGSPTFSLTLVAGATPTLIEVTDDDLIFDEVDGSQVLTNAVSIDGNAFAAGTSINTAYDLINSGTGHQLTSFHFGGDGYQQGPVDGVASTVPLTAGSTYTFDVERTSHTQPNAYTDFTACFAADTLILTNQGYVRVQDLEPGHLLETRHAEPASLRMALSRHVHAEELAAHPNLRPIKICAGALGDGLPMRDLVVSPQHRMLVSSAIVKRMFDTTDVLIAARKLTPLPGIFELEHCTRVSYFHLVMDTHEIIFAEGAPTESFYFGKQAIQAMSPSARAELATLFPQIMLPGYMPTAAEHIPAGRLQKRLVERHKKNCKPLTA